MEIQEERWLVTMNLMDSTNIFSHKTQSIFSVKEKISLGTNFISYFATASLGGCGKHI